MKTKLILSAFLLSILFSCSSDSSNSSNPAQPQANRDEFIGIWKARDRDCYFRIVENRRGYLAVGTMTYDGVYSLTGKGIMHQIKGDYSIQYYKEEDILIVSHDKKTPSAVVFDRRPDADSTKVDYGQPRIMEEPANAPARARPRTADTAGLVGIWHTSYPYSGSTVRVTLEIEKNGAGGCPEYTCSWTALNDLGGKKGDYRWCASYTYPLLAGKPALFIRENTRVMIYKNMRTRDSLTIVVEYPHNQTPWRIQVGR